MPVQYKRDKYNEYNGMCNCCGSNWRSSKGKWGLNSFKRNTKGITVIGEKVFESFKDDEFTLDHVETKQGTLTVLVQNA